MLTHFLFLWRIECLLLWRRSHEWLYPLAFFIIVITLFPLSFSPDPTFLCEYLPGCIWIAVLLANLLSITTLFSSDLEEGYIEQLLLSQTPVTLSIFAKLCAHWLITTLPLILLTPFLGLLYSLSTSILITLCLSLLLGTPILTLIGSLGAALTVGLRQQGVLLGLLILPLTIPILIFGVMIVQQQKAGLTILAPLSFLAGLLVLALCLLPWTIALSLRISMEE